MNLVFSPVRDATTGIFDHTPRVEFTVNGVVKVRVALRQPDDGFGAGMISSYAIRKLSEEQLRILKALGVSSPDATKYEYDVPAELHERFRNHLAGLGVEIPSA